MHQRSAERVLGQRGAEEKTEILQAGRAIRLRRILFYFVSNVV